MVDVEKEKDDVEKEEDDVEKEVDCEENEEVGNNVHISA